jgi:hypothetical protein
MPKIIKPTKKTQVAKIKKKYVEFTDENVMIALKEQLALKNGSLRKACAELGLKSGALHYKIKQNQEIAVIAIAIAIKPILTTAHSNDLRFAKGLELAKRTIEENKVTMKNE